MVTAWLTNWSGRESNPTWPPRLNCRIPEPLVIAACKKYWKRILQIRNHISILFMDKFFFVTSGTISISWHIASVLQKCTMNTSDSKLHFFQILEHYIYLSFKIVVFNKKLQYLLLVARHIVFWHFEETLQIDVSYHVKVLCKYILSTKKWHCTVNNFDS